MSFSESERAFLDKHHRESVTIWLALIATVFMYPVVAIVVDVEPQAHNEDSLVVNLALSMTALFQLLMAFFLSHLFLNPTKPAPAKGKSVLEAACLRYRTAVITRVTMADAATMMGLVITLLSGSWMYTFAFGFAGLVAMIVLRPNRDHLERYVSAQARLQGT